jgi:mono/diheme cytochrome c family protein
MRTRVLLLFALLGSALLTSCSGKTAAPAKAGALENAYDYETDWNDGQRIIPLNYQQAQGKRIFYQQCVWCHADQTPAGPSNRSNVTPSPPLWNDGAILNPLSDEYLGKVIGQGGSAMGRSAMMPPYGNMLTQAEIRALIAYARAIAVPPYASPGGKR